MATGPIAQVRAEHLAAHVDWVAKHKDVILVAGSLRHEPGQVPRGGLWIVEAKDKEAIEHLIRTDPFQLCGLRLGHEILHWSKALPDHKASI